MEKIAFKSLILLILFSFLIHPTAAYSAENSTKIAGISATTNESSLKIQSDNRAKILRKFLEQYNSPLAPLANTFVKEADKNKLDWKFVAAISGVESTFGKEIPYNSYNAWGWGIYGDNMIRFSSYEVGISTISKGLRDNYIDSWGAKDVYQIGKFYASSPTWAQRVDYFMGKIEQFGFNNPENTLSISL